MKKLLLILSSLISFFVFLSDISYADEISIVVNGNGSNSDSNVSVVVEQNNNVSQSNETTVVNTVSTDTSTGDNSANNNTGADVTITTGDSTTTTTITNQDINRNQVDTCCNSSNDLKVEVAGNGTDSNNHVVAISTNNNQVSQVNSANIHNQVNHQANTGNNQANSNTGGDTIITTGDIQAKAEVVNKRINSNRASIPTGIGNSQTIISGNGAGSVNQVSVENINDVTITSNNQINLDNLIDQVLNSGSNQANQNTGGNVVIVTGTVLSDIKVINQDINSNQVDDCCSDGDCCQDCDCEDCCDNCDCCDECDPCNDCDDCCDDPGHHCHGHHGGHGGTTQKIIEKTTTEKIIERYEKEIVYKDPLAGRGGQVLGAMLPATGGRSFNWLIANIIMFLLGTYLRIRSGRSPSMAK